jgi:hypothetical protein
MRKEDGITGMKSPIITLWRWNDASSHKKAGSERTAFFCWPDLKNTGKKMECVK